MLKQNSGLFNALNQSCSALPKLLKNADIEARGMPDRGATSIE